VGVSDSSRICRLPRGNESVQSATRVWFTLDYLGLSGVHRFWTAARRVESRGPSAEHRDTPAGASNVYRSPGARADRERRLDPLAPGGPAGAGAGCALPEFYSGANAGGMPRAGHVPGARNVPSRACSTSSGN